MKPIRSGPSTIGHGRIAQAVAGATTAAGGIAPGLLLRIAFSIGAIYEAAKRLLKTLRKSGHFRIEYEGSIHPVQRFRELISPN